MSSFQRGSCLAQGLPGRDMTDAPPERTGPCWASACLLGFLASEVLLDIGLAPCSQFPLFPRGLREQARFSEALAEEHWWGSCYSSATETLWSTLPAELLCCSDLVHLWTFWSSLLVSALLTHCVIPALNSARSQLFLGSVFLSDAKSSPALCPNHPLTQPRFQSKPRCWPGLLQEHWHISAHPCTTPALHSHPPRPGQLYSCISSRAHCYTGLRSAIGSICFLPPSVVLAIIDLAVLRSY